MKLIVTNGQEKMTLDTEILWHLKDTSFDNALADVIRGLKIQGWKVLETFENYEAWEYIYSNLENAAHLVK